MVCAECDSNAVRDDGCSSVRRPSRAAGGADVCLPGAHWLGRFPFRRSAPRAANRRTWGPALAGPTLAIAFAVGPPDME
jgi:hypothetical protein